MGNFFSKFFRGYPRATYVGALDNDDLPDYDTMRHSFQIEFRLDENTDKATAATTATNTDKIAITTTTDKTAATTTNNNNNNSSTKNDNGNTGEKQQQHRPSYTVQPEKITIGKLLLTNKMFQTLMKKVDTENAMILLDWCKIGSANSYLCSAAPELFLVPASGISSNGNGNNVTLPNATSPVVLPNGTIPTTSPNATTASATLSNATTPTTSPNATNPNISPNATTPTTLPNATTTTVAGGGGTPNVINCETLKKPQLSHLSVSFNLEDILKYVHVRDDLIEPKNLQIVSLSSIPVHIFSYFPPSLPPPLSTVAQTNISTAVAAVPSVSSAISSGLPFSNAVVTANKHESLEEQQSAAMVVLMPVNHPLYCIYWECEDDFRSYLRCCKRDPNPQLLVFDSTVVWMDSSTEGRIEVVGISERILNDFIDYLEMQHLRERLTPLDLKESYITISIPGTNLSEEDYKRAVTQKYAKPFEDLRFHSLIHRMELVLQVVVFSPVKPVNNNNTAATASTTTPSPSMSAFDPLSPRTYFVRRKKTKPVVTTVGNSTKATAAVATATTTTTTAAVTTSK